MTEIQTYSPDKDTDDSFRKDKERILTRYALELLPEFRSKIFGAKLKPEDSCIESADAEELLALISELHSYRASLADGIDQLRLTSAELEIVPMPLWCFARRRELRLQSIKTEQAALFQQALRKQASKIAEKEQAAECLAEPAP